MGNQSAQQAKEAAPGKKPYRKPELRFERIFEVRALVCGKQVGSTQSSCHFNTQAS